MQVASIAKAQQGSQSILKSANQQPQLAADLISKTIASMMQAQSVQTPAQPVTSTDAMQPGVLLNITA